MSGNLEMLRPGIQMIITTRSRKAHHEPKHDEHPGVYCHDVIQSSKPVHTYERNGRWAGSRNLRQCMNIVVLQATTHPSCRSQYEYTHRTHWRLLGLATL